MYGKEDSAASVGYPKLQGADSRLSAARPGSMQQQRKSETGSRRTSRHSDLLAYPSLMEGQKSRRTTAEQQTGGQLIPSLHESHPSKGQRLQCSTAEQQAAQPQHTPYSLVSLPADQQQQQQQLPASLPPDQRRRSSRPPGTGDQSSAAPGERRDSRRTTADGRPSQNGNTGCGRASASGQGVVHQHWPGADASIAVSHPGGALPHHNACQLWNLGKKLTGVCGRKPMNINMFVL